MQQQQKRTVEQIRRSVEKAMCPPEENLRLIADQIVMESEEFGPKQYSSIFEHSADAMAKVSRVFLGIRGQGHFAQFMTTPAYQKMLDAAMAYYDFEIGMLRAERGLK